MFDIQNHSSFVMSVIIFQLIPGAGTVTILNAAAKRGVSGGMMAVLGTLSGDFIYMLAAVLGLAAILAAYPGILAGAQWLGVAYLCWFGLKLMLAAVGRSEGGAVSWNGGWTFYRQALAVSLTNPKATLFFMAFFPLFLHSDSSPATLVVLMVHVTLISLLYQTVLVLAGNAIARQLSRWRYARLVAHRFAGAALIGFGVKLALGNR